MVGGKGIEGWGMELGNFGGEVGEVGEVGEREGERLSLSHFKHSKSVVFLVT